MPRGRAAAVAPPEPEPETLGEFEGRPVSSVKIIITKTGDGLSKAMSVAPTVLHQGDVGYIVLSYVTTKIRFDPSPSVDEDEELQISADRIQILEATGATFVDRDLIGDVVETMTARVKEYEAEQKRQRDERKGILSLPFRGDPEDPEGDED